MAMFRCGGGSGAKPLTYTQKIRYSDSRGNYGIAYFVIENKWKKVTALNPTGVLYTTVEDDDTGDRLALHAVGTEIDISNVKNLRLGLWARESAGYAGAEVTWVLS